MARSKLRDNLITVVLLVCVVAGCKQLQSLSHPTVLKSKDGKFQLTIPAGWRDDPTLSERGDIKADYPFKEMYVIVITEAKADFTEEVTLDQYTAMTRDSMTSVLSSSELSPPLPVTINGNAGRQYEIQGAMKNVNLAYLVTTVETSDYYHKIITWTLRSRIDANQTTLQQVAASFRPTADQAVGIGSAPSK
jgi:hypothetical protein